MRTVPAGADGGGSTASSCARVGHASAAGNEQAHNARHLEESGAAVALLGDVTGGHLREAVGPLLDDPARREAMAAAARAHGRPDAAERLVDVILSAVEDRA